MATTRSKSAAKASSNADGWSPDELAAVKASLEEHESELAREIEQLQAEIASMSSDAANATGDDQADAGSRAFERDHEVQTLLNAQGLLEQYQHALARLEAGTYGICESCGQPIAKGRLQAHPGATLCVTCKAAQERR